MIVNILTTFGRPTPAPPGRGTEFRTPLPSSEGISSYFFHNTSNKHNPSPLGEGSGVRPEIYVPKCGVYK